VVVENTREIEIAPTLGQKKTTKSNHTEQKPPKNGTPKNTTGLLRLAFMELLRWENNWRSGVGLRAHNGVTGGGTVETFLEKGGQGGIGDRL